MIPIHVYVSVIVPSAQPVVQVQSVESTALEFSWYALPCRNRNGDIRYRYQLKPSGSSSFIRSDVTDQLSVRLQDLMTNTAYEFQVAAINSVGQLGPFSTVEVVRTRGTKSFTVKHPFFIVTCYFYIFLYDIVKIGFQTLLD